MTECATQTTTDGAVHRMLDGLDHAAIVELDRSHVGEMGTAGFQLAVKRVSAPSRQHRLFKIQS